MGCQASNVTASNCTTARAGIYDHSHSSSAKTIGNYALGLEANLGYPHSNGFYVRETVALGFSNSTTQASLNSQMVANYGSTSFYIGLFGLSNQPGNFSTMDDSDPSYLTSLRQQNMIPSLSWSYTAGARYRSESDFGSLTFGGYDTSKFVSNNVSFPLAGDVSRDKVVPIQSISSKNSTGYSYSLLPTPISAYIDSTIPYIYLPLEACQLFEQTLGLVYDETAKRYPVNEGLHQSLLANNTNITFHLGNNGGSTVDIEMPYASFDLQGSFPFFPNGSNVTRYFPLQRATDDTQYTLGRTFLQEAYLITNYEASNFSVSQRLFNDNAPKQLVPILTTNETAALAAAAPHPVNWRLAVGLGVPFGVIFLLLLAFLTIFYLRRKQQPTRRADRNSGRLITRAVDVELPADLALAEAVPHKMFGYHEMNGTGKAELASEKYATFGIHEIGDTERVEMPADQSRKQSRIEVTSTIEVERSESFPRPPPTGTPHPIERPSSGPYVVSPVTPVEKQRKTHASTSNKRPPTIATSSNRSAPSDRSPVSSPTSGHPSIDKSLPPTPISSESARSSHIPPMSEVSPGLHLTSGVILRPRSPKSEYDENETFTPVSDVSEGPRIAPRVALPRWRNLPSTPVSPQSPRSPGSSRSFETAQSPAHEMSPDLQMTTQAALPPWRRSDDEDEDEDEGEPETSHWNVLRSPGESRWPPSSDSRW